MAVQKTFRKIVLIFILAVICPLSTAAYPGDNNTDSQTVGVSPAFDDFFEFKGAVELSQEKVLIGRVRTLKIDEDGNIWILDSKIMDIKTFSKSGQYIASMGERGDGPGGMKYPSDFFIFKDKVYVTDPHILRLHVFDKESRKFKYFVKMRDGRSIHVRNEDEIILSGQLLSPTVRAKLRKEDFLYIHIVNRSGKLSGSFFHTNETAIKNHLVSDGVFFCVDENNIYGIQEMEYKIYKFTPGGTLVNVFPAPNLPHYIPPPKEPINKKFLQSRLMSWVKSWTHIMGIAEYNDYLFITLNKPDEKPYEYLIDVYSKDGKFIKGGLGTSNRLLYIDKRGIFSYLQIRETGDSDIKYSILKYALKEQKNRGKG